MSIDHPIRRRRSARPALSCTPCAAAPLAGLIPLLIALLPCGCEGPMGSDGVAGTSTAPSPVAGPPAPNLTAGELKVLAGAQRDKSLYIEVSALSKLDYFRDHRLGMEKAGQAFGVKTEYQGPAELDLNVMAQTMELAIARRPGGIVVVGFNDSLAPMVDKAVAAGIPVVTVDADLPRSKRLAFVGTGNFGAGFRGGQRLSSLIGGKGRVAILTKTGQSNLEERVAGYKAALAASPGVEVVQVVNTESSPTKAAQAATGLLQRYPDLAGLACVEAAGGNGAATAVREAGKSGKVKVIAMDRDGSLLAAIKEGAISATIVQQTALMPFYAVQVLRQFNEQPVPIAADDAAAGVTGIPFSIDTGVVIVDSSNCDAFIRD